MTNPAHRLKKFVKYAGNEKPADSYVYDASGWLGSGVTDCNGVEIYEGDIVKCWLDESTPTEAMNFIVAFTNGAFVLDGNDQMTIGEIEALDIEVVGHIATEDET